jgi:hypothetical protein
MDVKPMLFLRYLAFAGLRRQRRLAEPGVAPPTFEVWDALVDTVEDANPEDEAEMDPTRRDQS